MGSLPLSSRLPSRFPRLGPLRLANFEAPAVMLKGSSTGNVLTASGRAGATLLDLLLFFLLRLPVPLACFFFFLWETKRKRFGLLWGLLKKTRPFWRCYIYIYKGSPRRGTSYEPQSEPMGVCQNKKALQMALFGQLISLILASQDSGVPDPYGCLGRISLLALEPSAQNLQVS